MECKYLNLYSLSGFAWSVASCIVSDKPYSPSVSELHNYCKGNGYMRCPVLLIKESTPGDKGLIGNASCCL